jgi:hypothetical protein
MHKQKQDLEKAARLADCELLAPSLRDTFSKHVRGEGSGDIRNRVIGPDE